MKIQVNGVEITPNMAKILNKWYPSKHIDDAYPYLYSKWLSKIQDYLTRNLVDMGDNDENLPVVKECLNMTIVMKDDFDILIPIKDQQEGGVA